MFILPNIYFTEFYSNITDSGNTRQTGNFQFCFRLISDFLFPPLLILCFTFHAWKLCFVVGPCTIKHIQLKDYFVMWSIRFVCHYRLTTDKWKLWLVAFRFLLFSMGLVGGMWWPCTASRPFLRSRSRLIKKKFFFFMVFCNLAPSWTSRASGKDKCAGNDTGEVTVTLLLLHSSRAPPVGQPDLFTSSLQSDTSLPPDNSTHFTFWTAFDLRQFRKLKILST